MGRSAAVEVPEIRFRPPAEVHARVTQIAESLGVTVTDVARMGLAQIANAREIKLVEPQRAVGLRDIPIHGASVGRIADIASAAARAVDQMHVQAGRLDPLPAKRSAG